jgi:hypothetical protein
MPVEEIAGSVVGGQPIAMQKKIVYFVGKDELFDFHVFRPQAGDQVDRLSEKYVAIIIAVDEKHWGAPGIHGGDGRRSVGQLG